MAKWKITYLATIIFFILINGCGFHLRGLQDTPYWLQNVTIISQDVHKDLIHLLFAQLKANHVALSNDPATTKFWIILEKDNLQQPIASISSSTTPRQHQLIYTLYFNLQRAKDHNPLPVQKIIVHRQWTENSDRILGSNDEAEKIASEMRQEAIIRLMYQLSYMK